MNEIFKVIVLINGNPIIPFSLYMLNKISLVYILKFSLLKLMLLLVFIFLSINWINILIDLIRVDLVDANKLKDNCYQICSNFFVKMSQHYYDILVMSCLRLNWN